MDELIEIDKYEKNIKSYSSSWNDKNARIVKDTLSDTFRSLQIVNDIYEQLYKDFNKISYKLDEIQSFKEDDLL